MVTPITALMMGLLACDTPAPSAEVLLARVSLDLRGVRPSPDELRRVKDDPAALELLIDDYMQDPRFGERVTELWAPVYRTRTNHLTLDLDYFSNHPDSQLLYDALGEEPLQLLARIAREDRPYTELVTADWTMADALLADIWPLEREPGEGWQPARYTDGRPAAGVLSTNTLWWRYTSSVSNANRARANAVSRILLCSDYTERPVELLPRVSLIDDDDLADAIRSEPDCMNCHITLDPIASHLFGFWHLRDSVPDALVYHPERERLWQDSTGVAPSWYGQPGGDLQTLGQRIAADPRFPSCAARQAWEGLVGEPPGLDHEDQLTLVRERFIQDGLTVRSLLRAVVDSERYRRGDQRKLLSPAQLNSQVEALTGMRWDNLWGRPLLATDHLGLRTLAGGADGRFALRDLQQPSGASLLLGQRLAEATASSAIPLDQAGAEDQRREILVELHASFHSRLFEPDSEEIDASMALFDALLAAEGEPTQAWAGLLAALMQHPDFLMVP